jgi:hypothetical protein
MSEVNYVKDISEVISIKIAALKKHESQIRTMRYDEAVEGLAKIQGSFDWERKALRSVCSDQGRELVLSLDLESGRSSLRIFLFCLDDLNFFQVC